jgi:dienelactone hydrolase
MPAQWPELPYPRAGQLRMEVKEAGPYMTYRSRALLLWASLALGACDELWNEDPTDAEAGAALEAPTDAEAGVALLDAAAQPDAATTAPEPVADVGPGPAASDASAADASLADAQAPDATLADASSPPPATDAGAPPPDARVAEYVVGTTRIEFPARDGRVLPVQLWYPAAESARAEASAGHPVSEFEPPGPRRALLERLLAAAPEGCANRRMHAAFDAPVNGAAAPYVLLTYSHHLEGMRIAQFSVAEALAKQGMIVAAPDHSSMTLFDRTDDLQTADLLGTVLRFQLDALALRAADIEDVISKLLDRDAAVIPAGIRGKLDPARVGAFGHSMGSMTTGVVAARDKRVKAAAYMSFPPATLLTLLNLLEQPQIESFRVPALFMLNQEDAPLSGVGGIEALREQYEAHAPLAYLVEVRDTGHWSFADDCALIPDFADGCGRGTRTTEPYEEFSFLPNAQARQSAARYVTAFFASQFLGQPAAAFGAEAPAAHEIVKSHPAHAPK